MALTPEEMQEVEAEMSARMGGAKPLPKAPGIGGNDGGMGFGKIAAPGSPAPDAAMPFNPMDTTTGGAAGGNIGGDSTGSAMSGLASGLTGSLGLAKALRGKGGDIGGGLFGKIKGLMGSDEQVPETTPLPE